MEILVCIKQVPAVSQIKMNPDTNSLIRDGVPSIINPFDKNALEEAVKLKELHGGKVTVLSMGPEQAKIALKECISVGADRAVLVCDDLLIGSDTLATSYVLSEAIKKIGVFDLVLCGRQAVDGDTGQVGPEIAEHLGWAQITYVSKIEINESTVIAERENNNGYETIESKLPLLCTVVKEINQPRTPSLKGKMASNKAVIEVLTAEDLNGIDLGRIGQKGSPTSVDETFAPPKKEKSIVIQESTGRETAMKLFDKMAELKFI